MDDLSAHHAPRVANAIYLAGHRPLFRPPYQPEDAPIEYIINKIDTKLRARCYEAQNLGDLFSLIPQVIAEIDNVAIKNTFLHCGCADIYELVDQW